MESHKFEVSLPMLEAPAAIRLSTGVLHIQTPNARHFGVGFLLYPGYIRIRHGSVHVRLM